MTEARWLALPEPAAQIRFLPLPVSPRKVRLFGCLCLQRVREWLSPEGRDALDVAERFAHGRATDTERKDAFRRLVEGCGGYIGPLSLGRPWCTASIPDDPVALAVALVIATPGEALLNIENGLPVLDSYEDVRQLRWVAQSCLTARTLAEGAAQARVEATRGPAGRAWNRLVRAVAERFGSSGHPAPGPTILQQETEYQSALLREIFGNPFGPVAFSPDWRTDTVLILARQMDEACEFSAVPILADALQDAGCDNEPLLNHCRDTSATHIRGCWALDLVLARE
jgi:hypothetical protein